MSISAARLFQRVFTLFDLRNHIRGSPSELPPGSGQTDQPLAAPPAALVPPIFQHNGHLRRRIRILHSRIPLHSGQNCPPSAFFQAHQLDCGLGIQRLDPKGLDNLGAGARRAGEYGRSTLSEAVSASSPIFATAGAASSAASVVITMAGAVPSPSTSAISSAASVNSFVSSLANPRTFPNPIQTLSYKIQGFELALSE